MTVTPPSRVNTPLPAADGSATPATPPQLPSGSPGFLPCGHFDALRIVSSLQNHGSVREELPESSAEKQVMRWNLPVRVPRWARGDSASQILQIYFQ